jgi:cell division protein FtsL
VISHRYATAGRLARAAERNPPEVPAARAGRERLAQFLDGSFLARLMLAMMLVAIASIIYLAQASQESILQFGLSDLQQQQMQLNSKNAALQAQMSQLQSTQRFDSTASQRLGMVKPSVSPVWLSPTVPRFQATPPPDVSLQKAEQESQPLAWMKSFVSAVLASL